MLNGVNPPETNNKYGFADGFPLAPTTTGLPKETGQTQMDIDAMLQALPLVQAGTRNCQGLKPLKHTVAVEKQHPSNAPRNPDTVFETITFVVVYSEIESFPGFPPKKTYNKQTRYLWKDDSPVNTNKPCFPRLEAVLWISFMAPWQSQEAASRCPAGPRTPSGAPDASTTKLGRG